MQLEKKYTQRTKKIWIQLYIKHGYTHGGGGNYCQKNIQRTSPKQRGSGGAEDKIEI